MAYRRRWCYPRPTMAQDPAPEVYLVYSSDVEQSDQEKASSHSKHGEQRESRGQGQSERSDAPQVS
ncbi:MAG: hypothetical protein AB7P69_24215, partial [Candidatus Binatia bacterium]